MDVKITAKRLKNMLAYEWVKIIAISVAIILVWSLAFTTFATRATDGQQFYIVVYDDVYDDDTSAVIDDMKADGALSYDVLKSAPNYITEAGSYSALYMLNLRLSANEGDIMIVNATDFIAKATPSDEDEGEDDSKTDEISDMESILTSGYVADFEDFVTSAGEYCERFTVDGSESGEIDDSKVETYFRTTRVKSARNYKKTYNTEAKIALGVKDEIARISKLQESYLRVKRAIDSAKANGVELLRYWDKPIRYSGNEVVETKKSAYGIDLSLLAQGANESKKKLSDDWWLVDENNEITTDGLMLCVLENTKADADLKFEALTAVDYVIRNYSNYAD